MLSSGLIWDSSERYALVFTVENLEYCCGAGMTLRGIEELRLLIRQVKVKRNITARGMGNRGINKSRKFFT